MNANVRAQLLAAGAKLPAEPKKSAQVERKPRSAPKEPRKPKEANSDELEAQSQKRKDNAQRKQEAELSRLNEAEQPRYHQGKGESTLDTLKFFHLKPHEIKLLIEFATLHLGASPA